MSFKLCCVRSAMFLGNTSMSLIVITSTHLLVFFPPLCSFLFQHYKRIKLMLLGTVNCFDLLKHSV